MLEEVSGNAQLEQHLLSQLYEVQGSIAKIKANTVAGTVHPMAVLERVQDSWGSYLSAKRLWGWMAFPTAKSRQIRHNS